MSVRVAINGFGRTGRAAFRAAYERGAPIEWVAINDVADPEMLAHLLRHDTVYGPFPGSSRRPTARSSSTASRSRYRARRTRRSCPGPSSGSTS